MQLQPEYVLAGVVMKQLLAGEATANAFSMFENRSTGISRTPIHVHEHDDETLYILEGEMCAVIAGQEHLVKAGETIFLPRHIPHQLMNVSGFPTRYLLLCTPSGFERFLAEGRYIRAPGEQPKAPSPEELDRMRAAAPQFGITLLAGWEPEACERSVFCGVRRNRPQRLGLPARSSPVKRRAYREVADIEQIEKALSH